MSRDARPLLADTCARFGDAAEVDKVLLGIQRMHDGSTRYGTYYGYAYYSFMTRCSAPRHPAGGAYTDLTDILAYRCSLSSGRWRRCRASCTTR